MEIPTYTFSPARAIPVLAALFLFAAFSEGNPITYYLTAPCGSCITGTITTDGNIGVLAASDIIDWNLIATAVAVGYVSFDLEGPLSGNNSVLSVTGADLTASASGLFFDFNSSPSFFEIVSPAGSGFGQAGFQAELCVQAEVLSCNGTTPESFAVFVSTGGGGDGETGNQLIGSTTPPVPEPSGFVPLGLCGLGALVARRSRGGGTLRKRRPIVEGL